MLVLLPDGDRIVIPARARHVAMWNEFKVPLRGVALLRLLAQRWAHYPESPVRGISHGSILSM